MPGKRINVTILLFAFLQAGCFIAASQKSGSGTTKSPEGGKMTSAAPGLQFTASLKEPVLPLVSEQALDFDLELRNDGSTEVTVSSVENDYTPALRILDADGRVLGEYVGADRRDRVLGHVGTTAPPGPPETIALPPGKAEDTWVATWAYRDPLPPGRYAFEAVHKLHPGGPQLTSKRVSFEIVPAHVETLAMGHYGPARANTLMAWLATIAGSHSSRLLVRESGFTGHQVAQIGATPHGEFPSNSRLSMAAMSPDANFPTLSWVAVVSGSTVQLIQLNMSTLQWRSKPIPLPISDAMPIPRFPNRGPAVFLAAGKSPSGPALTGVVVSSEKESPKVWTIPLQIQPGFTACAFSMEGPIAVLLASDDGQVSRLHRIDVMQDGTIAAPERELAKSDNSILGMVTDMWSGHQPVFFVLEADRRQPNHVAWVRVPFDGQLQRTGLGVIAGWPIAPGPEHKAERPNQVALDIGRDGMPWLALLDSRGNLIGGKGTSSLDMLRESKTHPCLLPQVGAVVRGVTISCFDDTGMLIHTGGGAAGH